MKRRNFLGAMSTALAPQAANAQATLATSPQTAGESTLLFLDSWFLEHQDNVELFQGRAHWHAEHDYEDPHIDNQFAWATVYRDESSGKWRMLYVGSVQPITLMVAESKDGLKWRPLHQPDIQPEGGKICPHHLFTLQSADGGPVYYDPTAPDGFRFRLYLVVDGEVGHKRALANPENPYHALAKRMGPKRYISDHVVVQSRDGLHWSIDPKATWGGPPSTPVDSPVSTFYSRHLQRHVMLVRPRRNDRRIALQTSTDAIRWSERHILMQPDPMDPPQIQLYGTAVHPYEGMYVGFLHVFHNSSSVRTNGLNEMWGSVDSQLIYSLNGLHFQRGFRTPIIPLNEPGQQGSSMIYPTCMVEHNDELRIYSAGSKHLHFGYPVKRPTLKGQMPATAIMLHTLRKDGFVYLNSRGHWGTITTKVFLLREGGLKMNVQAPYGEVRFQLTRPNGTPLAGFKYEDCRPLREVDGVRVDIAWQKSLAEIIGKPVRLQVQMRNARLYALRGSIHFLDLQEFNMVNDGVSVEASGLGY
jgi:hypothetical protein